MTFCETKMQWWLNLVKHADTSVLELMWQWPVCHLVQAALNSLSRSSCLAIIGSLLKTKFRTLVSKMLQYQLKRHPSLSLNSPKKFFLLMSLTHLNLSVTCLKPYPMNMKANKCKGRSVEQLKCTTTVASLHLWLQIMTGSSITAVVRYLLITGMNVTVNLCFSWFI